MPILSGDDVVKRPFVLSADIVSLTVSFFALPTIAIFFWQRLRVATSKQFTVTHGTCLVVFLMTFLFAFAMGFMFHVGFRAGKRFCDATMILCITLRDLVKSSEFVFLIERAYVVTLVERPRHKTPEYVLSLLFIFVPYAAISGCMIYSAASVYPPSMKGDECVMGVRLWAVGSQLAVETAAQLYLTLRFLWPLARVHRDGAGLMIPMRKVMIRTFIGSAVQMCSNLAVRIPLTIFDGEPTWLCALTCKIDALLGACMLYWMTKPVYGIPPRNRSGEMQLGIGFEETGETELDQRPSESPEQEMDLKEMLAWCQRAESQQTILAS